MKWKLEKFRRESLFSIPTRRCYSEKSKWPDARPFLVFIVLVVTGYFSARGIIVFSQIMHRYGMRDIYSRSVRSRFLWVLHNLYAQSTRARKSKGRPTAKSLCVINLIYNVKATMVLYSCVMFVLGSTFRMWIFIINIPYRKDPPNAHVIVKWREF